MNYDRFSSKEDPADNDYHSYCEQVYDHFPTYEELETKAFSDFFTDIIHLYLDQDIPPKKAAKAIADTFVYLQHQKLIAVHDHQVRMRKKYEAATNWFEEKFPHGLGYLHPEHRGFIGINVITKQFIKEFLEVYEESKKATEKNTQPEWLSQALNEGDGTYNP